MTKKKQTQIPVDDARQSRKEMLLARKQAQQTRQIRIGVAIVVALLAVIAIVAIVNEAFLVPGRAVAVVNGDAISLRDFQERVQYERAQRIILLENQLEAFGGDVGIIQQLAPQAITELAPQSAEIFGQNVLDLMIDELIIQQAAAARGIVVTDEEVQKEIEATFGYLGGESPTPQPTPTETIMPTPSLTPIPTAVISDVLPTATPLPTATVGPTSTPRPSPTPVSEEFFQEEYGSLRSQFADLGVAEAVYLEVVRNSLLREKFIEALAEEEGLPREAEQVSIWVLSYDTEAEANEARAIMDADGFLTVWNTVRSVPLGTETESTGSATELLWRTQNALSQQLGDELASAAFAQPLNTPSEIIPITVNEETTRYYIIQPSGREVRPLSETEYRNAQLSALSAFVDTQTATGLELNESWRGRVPTTPVLDTIFFAPPTAAPTQPPLPTPAPLATEEAPAGDE